MKYHEGKTIDLYECKELGELFAPNKVDSSDVLQVGHSFPQEHQR